MTLVPPTRERARAAERPAGPPPRMRQSNVVEESMFSDGLVGGGMADTLRWNAVRGQARWEGKSRSIRVDKVSPLGLDISSLPMYIIWASSLQCLINIQRK